MVGLDFSDMDSQLIRYTAFLSYYYQLEKIYFVNVQPNLDIPEDLDEGGEDSVPIDEKLKQEMIQEVETHYPNYDPNLVDFKIIEGSPRREMLRWSHIKHIDLLIVGKKSSHNGSGIVPQQLARKVSCSVLFVPENAPLSLRKIILANDFSEYAKAALEQALFFKQTDPAIHVISNHVYTVPYGYYRTGKTEGQFAGIMEKHAKAKYENFVGVDSHAYQLIETEYTYNPKKSSPADYVYQTATRESADMIVTGARGLGAATALLLGSVAEKLLKIDHEIPVLIVKLKDRTFSFMDMIESI